MKIPTRLALGFAILVNMVDPKAGVKLVRNSATKSAAQ
jgi:hypothetical protein